MLRPYLSRRLLSVCAFACVLFGAPSSSTAASADEPTGCGFRTVEIPGTGVSVTFFCCVFRLQDSFTCKHKPVKKDGTVDADKTITTGPFKFSDFPGAAAKCLAEGAAYRKRLDPNKLTYPRIDNEVDKIFYRKYRLCLPIKLNTPAAQACNIDGNTNATALTSSFAAATTDAACTLAVVDAIADDDTMMESTYEDLGVEEVDVHIFVGSDGAVTAGPTSSTQVRPRAAQ